MGPLQFRPFLRPMVWGGRRLSDKLRKHLPDDQTYGESWEVSDHAMHHSRVENGPHRGQTLRDLMTEHRQQLLGPSSNQYAMFPWLVKFLDAHDWLSVQVHPDEEAVEKLLPGENSKTEAWFIIDTLPGSRVYAGLRDGVDERAFRQANANGTVAECLHSFEPKAGDCVFLPSGTVHAVGGGVLMAEIQQTSDATFRLFDWNRKDKDGKSRTLHIEEGMQSIHWNKGAVEPVRVANLFADSSDRCIPLVQCRYFDMEYVQFTKATTWTERRLQALLVIDGEGTIAADAEDEPISTGQVWILPAATNDVTCTPRTPLRMVRCTLPE